MSGTPKDGGPAFPSDVKALIAQPDGTMTAAGHYGMTLRDWFAAHAMTGMLAREVTPPNVAVRAYDYADAMLAARTAQ